ncbi:MAG: hypothetical protein AAF830_01435 [Pseudomonadota bacterium]
MVSERYAYDERTTLRSEHLKAEICHRGLRLASLRIAPFGHEEELLATLDDPSLFASDDHFLGAIVGPYANRIAHGQFSIDGQAFSVEPNEGPHLLHGGPFGFHTRLWSKADGHDANEASFRLTWHDPTGRFPGQIRTAITFSIQDATLQLNIEATTDEPTPFNPTYHPYFNLAPDMTPAMAGHVISINAQNRQVMDGQGIPTDAVEHMSGDTTVYNAAAANLSHPLDDSYLCPDGVVSQISHPDSERILTITSDAPSTQIYTGHHLGDDTGEWPYVRGAGVCVEPQHPPNSPNHPVCGSTILYPGQVFRRRMAFTFSRQR